MKGSDQFVRDKTHFDIDMYSNKGGFGQLYFGERKITRDRVALKFYTLDKNETEHFEPRILQELENEYIIPILEAKHLDTDIAYYVTPYISGGDLDKFIRSRKVKTNNAISIVQKVLRALNYLHTSPRNLVHMDLKLFNILIKEDGESLYLADFGAVKKISDGMDFVTKGQYTVPYMPPECITEERHYRQSDIYQMGIVLYQILHGDFPIENPKKWLKGKHQKNFCKLLEDEQQPFMERYIKEMIIKGKLIDLETLPPYIGKSMKSILKKALHLDRNKRFQTCHDFIKELHVYQNNNHDWWYNNEDGNIHAFCKNKNRFFRIVYRGKNLVVEGSTDQIQWRKVADGENIHSSIAYVNKL